MFKELYNLLSFKFSIVCFSETWSKDEKVNENSLYQLESYNLLHQNRKHKNGGGVAVFAKDSYSFKNRDDLRINSEGIESLSLEIRNNESKKIISNVVYRPLDGVDVCGNYFMNIFFKENVIRKNILVAGDFNINLLHFEQNKKVQNFINLMFQFGLVAATNKLIRITKDTISAIGHVITNSIIN